MSAGRGLRRLWGRIPGSRLEIGLLWAIGLGLGAAGFVATLTLPLSAALACWAVVAAIGCWLAFGAEPLLWEAPPEPAAAAVAPTTAAPETSPTPARPAPPVLLDLVTIPGGDFRMGSPPATEAQIRAYAEEWAPLLDKKPEETLDQVRDWLKTEQPAHPVRLSPFRMARTPVTRGQWRAVMAEAPDDWGDGDDDLPATHIDWPGSLAFCNALSEREGLTPCYLQDEQGDWHWDRAADGYRLPTEAEWEYACRAGSETRWFWGDEPDGADRHAWFRGNADGQLHPVGGKAPNRFELRDMAGLVFEWCWDRYGPYPPDPETRLDDPAGPVEGERRVVRGGSFDFPPFFLRSAGRDFGVPEFQDDSLGLRCVRSGARQH
jgi:formylglycine-generating enzyme required for sulfatase activity